MLYEIAIADAYGAGFEFSPPDDARPNDGLCYHRNAKHPSLRPGAYTDDTQMSIAVAECLLADCLEVSDFAAAFVSVRSKRSE